MDKRVKATYLYMLNNKYHTDKARVSYAVTMVLKPTQRQAGFRKYFLEFLNKYRNRIYV